MATLVLSAVFTLLLAALVGGALRLTMHRDRRTSALNEEADRGPESDGDPDPQPKS